MKPTRSRQSSRGRRGVVALELALFLPFLMGLLMVLFTVASVAISHTEVTLQARHQAWTGRHRPWRSSARYRTVDLPWAVPERVAQIQGGQRRLEPHETVTAESTLKIPVFFLAYRDAFPDARAEHSVQGGSWDYQEIAFPERREHRPLTPVRKVYYFTNAPYNFADFQALAAFVSPQLAAAQAAASAHHGSVAGQHSPVGDLSDPARVIQGIRDKEAELADIEDDLDDARSQDPPDEGRIRDLERQRDSVRADLEMLYTALEHLRRAGR